MRILLDTNAYSAWKRGHEGVATCIRRAERVVFSSIVAGELLFGFRVGARAHRNLRELDEILSRAVVSLLPVTLTTAHRFAVIAATLRRRGTPLPTNDLWIAAQAMESGAELVSFDDHFSRIDGLLWVKPS